MRDHRRPKPPPGTMTPELAVPATDCEKVVIDMLHLDARGARAEIKSGALRGAALVRRLRSIPPRDRDAWVDECLGLPEAPPDVPDLPPGAVPYLPAGVDEIVA